MKELIKSQMSSIKDEIKEIKSKQDMIEEKKIKGLEERKRVEEEMSSKIFSEIHSVDRTCRAFQPLQPVLQPVLHPDGKHQASCQPVEQVVT